MTTKAENLEDLANDEAEVTCDTEGNSTRLIIEEARGAAAEVLSVVEISRIVIVDEDFEASITDVVSALLDMGQDTVTIPHIGQLDLSEERENWETDLRDSWDVLTVAQREEGASYVFERSGSVASAPDELEFLKDLLHTEVELLTLTPAQWSVDASNILATASETPTMVLFDREIHDDVNEGRRLVSNLLSADEAGEIWAGLLTNTATVLDEGTLQAELAEHDDIPSERFILLSKGHLNEENFTFVEALRIALMAKPASKLLHSVAASIASNTEKALSHLHSLSPVEFERIVFGLSREEGSWEVDMLLRLFDAFLRADVRVDLHSNMDVQSNTKLLRGLDQRRGLETINASTQAQVIYRRELYEDKAHLAAVSAPIELGDLFEKEESGKSFIVVAQPCDLMIRPSGRREPELPYVTLLPIVSGKPDDARVGFELPAFRDNASWWVHLGRPSLVPIEALDFCALDREGRSLAPTENDEDTWRLPGWDLRLEELLTKCISLRGEMQGKSKDDQRALVRAKFGVRAECPLRPQIEADDLNFSFGIRRSGRLLSPFARALLTSFGAHQTRTDFDRAIA